MVNAAIERRAIHSETPAIRENETFRRNRSMLMAEQWPQKQLDNSTSGGAGTLAVVRGCLRGSLLLLLLHRLLLLLLHSPLSLKIVSRFVLARIRREKTEIKSRGPRSPPRSRQGYGGNNVIKPLTRRTLSPRACVRALYVSLFFLLPLLFPARRDAFLNGQSTRVEALTVVLVRPRRAFARTNAERVVIGHEGTEGGNEVRAFFHGDGGPRGSVAGRAMESRDVCGSALAAASEGERPRKIDRLSCRCD
jgi:hypothetical protein